jgi:urease accessory protein
MIGMSGRLRLTVGLDGVGRCTLREQYGQQLHRVLHLIEGGVPSEGLVYLLNPTGGIVQGDELDAQIRVEAGAHAIVTSPSATRVYSMDRGEAASRMDLRVEPGAILEYLPEPLIPHAKSRFRETLGMEVAEGGRALAWEILSPGREARGESLAYERLSVRLDVKEGGQGVLRERAEILPGEGLGGPAILGRFRYYAILVVLGGPAPEVEAALRDETRGTYAGVTRLEGTGVVLKALDTGSQALQRLLARARERVMPLLSGRPAFPLRRT